MIDKFMYGFIDRVYGADDYTQQEINAKLIQKMDEVIENCNNAIEFLDWLKEQGMSEELQSIIDTMINDGTFEKLINIDKLNRIETELNNSIDNVNSEVENIAITMPPPSTVDENTKNLQDILDRAKDKNVNLTVQFLGGHYELNTCIIYDNTTIKMTNNTELKNNTTRFSNPNTSETTNVPILFMNAKPLDSNDSNISGYNGRSNITIEGGIIDCISAFCFCHGKNITIKNVIFKNCSTSHYIQIGACKNVKIQNCKFVGTTEKTEDRNYVEFIQIDWMTSAGQPYWSSTANIFDSTVNEGIEIDGCEFVKGINEYNHMYTCIGSHSGDGENKNKDIIIKNCKFTGYSYRALTINKMKNVFIDNNIFEDTESTGAIQIAQSDNITVTSTNKINGGRRAISVTSSTNIEIDGLLIENLNSDSDIILIGESSNVELNNIKIVNSHTTGFNVLIRSSKNVNAFNCRDINTIADGGYFFKLYKTDGENNERITIKDTITDKKEIYKTSTNSLISPRGETLWQGDSTTDEIILNDSIDKFKNLKIYLKYYGNFIKDLSFVNNISIIREFNLADDIAETNAINFVEIRLTLDPETNKITITSNNQLTLLDGSATTVTSLASIYRITGERICY